MRFRDFLAEDKAEGRENNTAFNRWFSGSKAVDKSGKPKVFYHYTTAKKDFRAFRTAPGAKDVGSHFGTANQVNDIDSGRPPVGQRVYPVYLRVKNPLRLEDTWRNDAYNVLGQLVSKGIVSREDAQPVYDGLRQRGKAAQKARKQVVQFIKDAGYDSIVYLNVYEGTGIDYGDELWAGERYASAEDSYIVFDPDQVKSAIANKGTYRGKQIDECL